MSPLIWRNCAVAITAIAAACATVSAQAGPTDRGRTQIIFLGTAAGPPLRVNRSEPSTLLIVDDHLYLIDCGIGTAERLVKAGIESNRIKTILFTHLHADHDMGLADVMANDYFTGESNEAADPINIYGPPQTKQLVDSAFQFVLVGFRPFAAADSTSDPALRGGFRNPFVSHEFNRGGLVFEDARIRVTSAENSHYVLIPSGRRSQFKTYSYRIETPDGVIVFTGDTGPSGAITQFATDADLLVAEASYRDAKDLDETMEARAARSHLPPTAVKSFRDHFVFEHLDAAEIGHIAANERVKAVILYHYNPTNEADRAAYVSGVRKLFSGPVFAPNDLDAFCLSSGTVRPCPLPPRPHPDGD
jgi:ribonuclease BN (tRNA processing enzyme)